MADRDILAPESRIYDSAVLTERTRQETISQAEAIYDPNPDITRGQIRLAASIRDYITHVRGDKYAPDPVLVNDLRAIASLNVSMEVWQAILDLPDNRWDLIGNEMTALVERTMQGNIRDGNLRAVRNSLENSVASRFNNSEAEIVVAIAEDLIQPNTFYNEDTTRAMQAERAAQVPIQQASFEEGELIVRAGEIVTEENMEALEEFGLLDGTNTRLQSLLSALLAMSLTTLILWLYIDRFEPKTRHNQRLLALIASLFLIFLATVNLFGVEGVNQPYLYPAAALALLLTSLVGIELAIISASMLAILVGVSQPPDQALHMAAPVVVGSVAGVLTLRQIDRLNSYFLAGLSISGANLTVFLAFELSQAGTVSATTLLAQSIVAATSGLFAAGIALVALYVITNLLNLTTSLKLIELMDSKHPLLQRLLREAPGTYQHSLQVGNLSELAAEAIGANAGLVRVAAMYHDIGKILNPFYFVENTTEGMNPHDDLNDPLQSARVIIGHVTEGDRLARRYNLPHRIREFILEHHGTTQALYFYNQATERAEHTGSIVKIEDFTYPGPTPRSRETAIMMLADGCESATRSRRPSTKAEIEEVVNTIFEMRLNDGQLDNSNLTLNDLKAIRSIFVETLQAMYHPRIAYQVPARPMAPQLKSGTMKAVRAEAAPAPEELPSPSSGTAPPEASAPPADLPDRPAAPSEDGETHA
ncbi:MAG: HDIG domain-containing protein [Anaerolineae bacterium]|nr:HDIG domain-containing protein [Anaerolineae bacterium]